MYATVLIWSALIGGHVDGEFALRFVGTTPRDVSVATVAADGSLTLADGQKIAAGDWCSLRRLQRVLPDWPRDPHIELVNGDRICGTVVGADGDALRIRLAIPGADQILRFPLSALRAVWFTRRPQDDPDWLIAPRKRDVIQNRNGDLALGALVAIDVTRNVIQFQADGKDRQLDLFRIAAIGFNTDLARIRKPKGPYYRMTLLDGTRISVSAVTFDGKTWTGQTLFKEELRVTADRQISLDIEQGTVVSLSDLKPTAYQYQSFDGEQYSWAADRNAAGGDLRLRSAAGDSTFDRGIGLHSECTVTYALGGKYGRFETLAGLDARIGTKGDAVLAVFVDGKEHEISRGGKLTFSDGPIAVNVDVKGGKELKIVVRRGNGGNVQDYVNLAEARLVP